MSNGNPYLAHLDGAGSAAGRERQADKTQRLGGWRRHTQPAAPYRRPAQQPHHQPREPPAPVAAKPKRPVFTYGNYEHYYGYRDSGSRLDPRLAVLDAMLFQGKRVLDIGCNAGLLTVSIAMLFGPAVVEGVDIDPTLVRKARAHLAYRSSCVQPIRASGHETRTDGSGEQAVGDQEVGDAGEIDYDYFPASCAAMFGTLPIVMHESLLNGMFPGSDSGAQEAAKGNPNTNSSSSIATTAVETLMDAIDADQPADATDYILDAKSSPPFPSNIRFRCGNWLYEPPPRSNDARYHTILALSITKWIHLNWGDAGLCSFFSRCYDALLPGGHLVLEPQPFDSYGKRSNLTPDMHKHYANIKLRPEMFAAHLLSSRVGFRSMSQVAFVESAAASDGDASVPMTKTQKRKNKALAKRTRGFARPVYVFVK